MEKRHYVPRRHQNSDITTATLRATTDPQTPMRRSRSLDGRRLELRRHSGSDKRFLWNVLKSGEERGNMFKLGGMGTDQLSIVRGQIISIPNIVSPIFFLQKPDYSEPGVVLVKFWGQLDSVFSEVR